MKGIFQIKVGDGVVVRLDLAMRVLLLPDLPTGLVLWLWDGWVQNYPYLTGRFVYSRMKTKLIR